MIRTVIIFTSTMGDGRRTQLLFAQYRRHEFRSEVGEIKIDSNRVEAMVLEKSGPRLFLDATEKNEVAVIDWEKRAVVATWPVTGGRVNVAMTIDEAHHRLFVACRGGHLSFQF